MPTAPEEQSQTPERRAFVRYPTALATLWQFLGVSPREVTSGKLVDLSVTGVGLVLDHSFPVQTALVIRLPTATQGWCSHLVRVKHCTQVGPNSFQVGCTFVRPLSPAQLQAHLV